MSGLVAWWVTRDPRFLECGVQGCHVTSEAVVAVALPNGAEMGITVLATMACAVCAPLNVDLTPEELLKDMQVWLRMLPGVSLARSAAAMHDWSI